MGLTNWISRIFRKIRPIEFDTLLRNLFYYNKEKEYLVKKAMLSEISEADFTVQFTDLLNKNMIFLDAENNFENDKYALKYFSEWKNNLLAQKQLFESENFKVYNLSSILRAEFSILSFLNIEHIKDFKSTEVNADTVRTHRLYKDQKEDLFFSPEKSFVRREFKKSDSRTILLGGKLVGKVIVRIVDEEALIAWKKAFEAEELWKKLGFDYAPVEPILSKNGKLRIFKTKDNKYRVYTKVLGPSLKDFMAIPENYKYADYLGRLRRKIIDGLKWLKISHGHYHEDNFCVEYFDNDLRMYIIDFDWSSSTRSRRIWPF